MMPFQCSVLPLPSASSAAVRSRSRASRLDSCRRGSGTSPSGPQRRDVVGDLERLGAGRESGVDRGDHRVWTASGAARSRCPAPPARGWHADVRLRVAVAESHSRPEHRVGAGDEARRNARVRSRRSGRHLPSAADVDRAPETTRPCHPARTSSAPAGCSDRRSGWSFAAIGHVRGQPAPGTWTGAAGRCGSRREDLDAPFFCSATSSSVDARWNSPQPCVFTTVPCAASCRRSACRR